MSIELLDPNNAADVDAVAALHEAYLAGSPIMRMGKRYLRKFHYSTLVRSGLIGCTLCRIDGRVVGFISYTAYPLDFMSRGLRRYFFPLAWLMLGSVLARPALLKEILMTLRMMGERSTESRETDARGLGEALSLVVIPEFQNYIPPGGRSRVAFRLFEVAVERLREQGVDRVYLWVQPTNRAANLLYSTMGCSFEKINHLGQLVHRYTYHVKARPETPGSEPSR